MSKIHKIHRSMNTPKISINRIAEYIVNFKKIRNAFFHVYVRECVFSCVCEEGSFKLLLCYVFCCAVFSLAIIFLQERGSCLSNCATCYNVFSFVCVFLTISPCVVGWLLIGDCYMHRS